MTDEFHADERIAGFYLACVKKVLGWVGITEDRDDVANTCEALGCGPRLARRVLDELERRGFVVKGTKPNQWTTTEKGHRVGHHWTPPAGFDRRSSASIDSIFWASHEGEHLVKVDVMQPHDSDEDPGGGTIELSVYLSRLPAAHFEGRGTRPFVAFP